MSDPMGAPSSSSLSYQWFTLLSLWSEFTHKPYSFQDHHPILVVDGLTNFKNM